MKTSCPWKRYRIPVRFLAVLILLSAIAGCSGTRLAHQASTMEQVQQQREEIDDLHSPVKVYRVDGTIFLFRRGARVSSTAIWGVADVMTPDGSQDTGVNVTLAASEIAGATLYEFKQSAGSIIGAGITGVLGAYSWLMAAICLADPKQCFGSCPTVYVPDRDSMLMVAELFSTSISPSLARSDLDRLCTVDGEAPFPIMVTNEAVESHYIDKLQFVYVPHDPDETALPQPGGSIVLGGRRTLDVSARSSQDLDLTHTLRYPDGTSWRSGPELLLTLPPDDPFDHVDIATVATGAEHVDLRVRWKNTLLSTVLFYNLVLGDQGLHALAWQQRLDTDPIYAAAFSMMYDRYSGVRVLVWDGNEWNQQAVMTDAGPIVWHEGSVTVPTFGQDTLRIRLRGLADNLEIDAVEIARSEPCAIEEIPLHWEVLSTTVPGDPDIRSALAHVDGDYFLQDPSESTALLLHLPPGARHGTVFVRSHGWYYEWVRQQWIKPSNTPRSNDMLNGEGMIRELGKRWMDEHALIEDSFHRSTIPLKRP